MTRLLLPLALLLAAGCAGAPAGPVKSPTAPQAGGKPPAASGPARMPPSVFLGNYPAKNRDWAQKCFAALPAELRRGTPPFFRLVSAAEIKKLPIAGVTEAAGAYDPTTRTVYSRPEYQQMLPHEFGGHWAWYEGRDPKSKFAPLMTKEEIADWISWNDHRENFTLIPQACYDLIDCNRKRPHESFAQAACVVWYPDPRGHPNFGKPNPRVVAKLRGYFGP